MDEAVLEPPATQPADQPPEDGRSHQAGEGLHARSGVERSQQAGEGLDARRRRGADRRLLEAYHRDGDLAARTELVERFLPLARQLAARYRHRQEPLDDLVQVASLGLVKAIDRFDPTRDTAFSSFAVPTILGELKRHFRDRGWAVRVPRPVQELALRLDGAVEDLSGKLGRSPTVAEVCEFLDEPEHEVLEALEAGRAYRTVSFDRPLDDDEEGETVETVLGHDDPGYGRAEEAALVQRLLRALPAREREVLRLRFEEDLTQTEIGERVGVSQMHVSRLIDQALRRLRVLARGA